MPTEIASSTDSRGMGNIGSQQQQAELGSAYRLINSFRYGTPIELDDGEFASEDVMRGHRTCVRVSLLLGL